MAPISPGSSDGPLRKAKKKPAPTATTNLHRYESFTRRISRLKIDPIHAVGSKPTESNDIDLSHSFFQVSLEEWAELNLSQTFTTFLNQVNPLCENLPQLLHHADSIFDFLLQTIQKQDALALEPLLSLLAHLAHDLGQKYEQYLPRTVQVVAKVAAAHEDADVVEWSFTCLAWMFKYLSRLLVQDLRQLIDIMIPYLSARKDYIVRFSAEALAFLLRKTFLLYTKKKAPLRIAIKHIFERLLNDESEQSQNSFRVGVMTLCVESVRGIEGQLHSSAESLIRCLLYSATPLLKHIIIQSTVTGILIALIHETDSSSFRPILEVVEENCQQLLASLEVRELSWALRLLHVVIGSRNGSRLSVWTNTIRTISAMAEVTKQDVWEDIRIRRTIILVVAETFQYAPMDQLLPFSKTILDLMTSKLSVRDFFSFCTICAKLGKGRFVDLVVPHLQQFILDRWSHDEISLHYTLETLHKDGITSRKLGLSNCIMCPANLEISVAEQLIAISANEMALPVEILAGRLHLTKNTHFTRDSKTARIFIQNLQNLIATALKEGISDQDIRRRVMLGWGLDSFLDSTPDKGQENAAFVPLLLSTEPINFRLPTFLAAANRLLKNSFLADSLDDTDLGKVRHCLLQNLLSTSSLLKIESLKMLSVLAPVVMRPIISEIVELMLEILETPYTPTEVRKIAMLLRRLPRQHTSLASQINVQDMVPFFCLGLLSHYHDATRKEVCNILAQIVEDAAAEETVLNILMQWLQTPQNITSSSSSAGDDRTVRPSPFECTRLSHAEELCDQVFQKYLDPSQSFRSLVENAHQLETSRTPESGRALALQVLSSIPASAERRSRLLVPIFLSAPMNREQLHHHLNSDASTSSYTLSPEVDDHAWSLSDRKAFLLLFSKFNNPRVLFRSAEVHEKLLDLLGNGNGEVRKLALQAILTWKDPKVKSHEDKLLQVVEEKTTNTDLALLLSVDKEQGTIKGSDRGVVFPILLRLIFGLVVGRSGTAGSQEARRRAILRNLFRMDKAEIAMFIDIALGKLREVRIPTLQAERAIMNWSKVPEDQQYGFLRLLSSVLDTLQSQFSPYGQQVVDAVVFCVVQLPLHQQSTDKSTDSPQALSRNIRRVGVQCLALLFTYCPDIDWLPYLPSLFANAISPRLDTFAAETSQGISGFLRLFASWVGSHKLVCYLRSYDARLPGALWQCLALASARTDVKLFILDEIVIPWLFLAEDASTTPNIARVDLELESNALLLSLTTILEQTPPREILIAVTNILPRLASFATSLESKQKAIQILTILLRGSEYKLSPDIKSKLLISIQSFVHEDEIAVDEPLRTSLWSLVSSLFNFFKDEPNRLLLCRTLKSLARESEETSEAVQLCFDLNATSSQRLDEYDYDKRLEAFQAIKLLSTTERDMLSWLPITHNLLFFIRTEEDFAIRSNAVACLRQFVIRACTSNVHVFKDFIKEVVIPSVRRGTRDESELVRTDFVSLYGLLVQQLPGDKDLADMAVLLVGDDDEASFFSNILHIQQHRRLRAIRRLLSEVEKGAINPQNIAEFFIPLLEMFAYDSSGEDSVQGTKGQSIAAMGVLLQWIDWRHFKILFRKYKNDVNNTYRQKDTIKLLGHAADALLSARQVQLTAGTSVNVTMPYLSNSLCQKSVLENEVRTHFIPRLAGLVHYKDETEMSFRIPVAVTSIKLIKILPTEEVALTAAPIILDIAHILKSRTQESRDIARNALSQIVLLLGPSSLQFVLKELRTALTRGYQLHVLSYTLHTILVALATSVELGALDYCIGDIVAVAIDDIFGAVGQEKDNQDYVSSMKEVKSSKSFDTMELLARSTSVSSLSKLVAPVQTILSGKLGTKQVRQVEEVLRRIGAGVSQNPAASERDLLVFAYQLIEAFYKEKSDTQRAIPTSDEKARQRFLIQLSAAHKTTSGLTSPLVYKIARFALDLVRSTLQKHDDLMTAENIHGFLPVIGDALLEAQEDVKISALRLLSAIIKIRMPQLDRNGSLYVTEAVKVVENSTNTNEEAAQAALKLIAAVLRERKSINVRDSDIAELLHRVTPDIEEPDRQGVTFNFIRAVMARKIQLPEIYELVDKVGIMMVTNQTRGARDVARGVYVHFLLEYPQSSSRWAKQQKFLLKNLEYDYPEGRQSVMEAINTLIQKLKGEAGEELTSILFIPTLLRMANDESKNCRELAGVLLGQIFTLATQDQLKEFLLPMRSWLEQDDNQELQKISMQAYTILFDSNLTLADSDLAQVRDNLSKSLLPLAKDDDDQWEVQFQALVLLSKLVEHDPIIVLNQAQAKLWSSVWRLLDHHNAWIQSTVASLIHTFFQDCMTVDLGKIPLTCMHGLRLGPGDTLAVLKSSVRILKHTVGNEELRSQVIQNLLFLAQSMAASGLSMEVSGKDSQDQDEDTGLEDEMETDVDELKGTRTIPAVQYLIDQMARILRLEIISLKAEALLPKISALRLLGALIPTISMKHLTASTIRAILLPLQHLTDTNTVAPRSADPTFSITYQNVIEQCHEVMNIVQHKVGDADYVKALTEVSKIVRQRRYERRTKRRIERVAEPEKAAREKKRKADRKKERKKEIGRGHQKRRREGGM